MSWKHLAILSVLAFGLFIQACARKVKPEESCNFVQNSLKQRVSWGTKLPVKMMVHESIPQEQYQVIRDAAKTWKELMGQEMIKITQWGVRGSAIPQKDGYSIISLLDEWDENKKREQARTSVYWRGSQILEADIRLNDKNFDFSITEDVETGRVDLFSLILHEMGHVLGLSHIEEDESVMRSELAKGQERRKLDHSGPDFWAMSCEY